MTAACASARTERWASAAKARSESKAHLRNASRNSARESLPSPSRSILTKCSRWCWIVELGAKVHLNTWQQTMQPRRQRVQVDVEKLHHVADLDRLWIGCSSDGCALVTAPLALLVLLDCEQPVHVVTSGRNGICAGRAASAHAKGIDHCSLTSSCAYSVDCQPSLSAMSCCTLREYSDGSCFSLSDGT